MNNKFEYIEFVFRANEPNQIAIETSPLVLENIARSLEKRLRELGVEPLVRQSEYQNNQYFFFHTSRVDMFNALQADGWEAVSNYSANISERYLYKRPVKQEQVSENKPSLYDVVELVKVSNTIVVNGYLKLGWILLETEKSQYSENGHSIFYCLAWSKKNGVPVYPDIKSDSEYTEKVIHDVVNKSAK